MPKFLFSKIRFYEFKDRIQNVKRPRRIDIVFNRSRREKDTKYITVHHTTHNDMSHQLSWQTDPKLHPTLEKMLRDKKYLAAFQSFLQSEFSEENVEFWFACEDFRASVSPDDLSCKAQQIYQRFIQPAACREINVDHHIREKIKKSLDKPSPSCFNEAQKQVYLLMERDSCPRFLQSDVYLSLKNKSRTLWYI